jgi:hypothetical protein
MKVISIQFKPISYWNSTFNKLLPVLTQGINYKHFTQV